MPDPVSTTATSAAATSAVVLGKSGGAMSGGVAAGSGTGAKLSPALGTAGTTAPGSGATSTMGVAGSPTTIGSAAQASGPPGPASVPIDAPQSTMLKSPSPAEPMSSPPGSDGHVIMDAAHIVVERPTDATGATARAATEGPIGLPGHAGRPTAEHGPATDLLAKGQHRPEAPAPEGSRRHESDGDPPGNGLRAGPDRRPLDQPSPMRPGDLRDANDPHEQERQALNELLEKFEDLSERELWDLMGRLTVWDFRESERTKDRTVVIGPEGMDENWRYHETRKKRAALKKTAEQFELSKAISQGNPLSGALGHWFYNVTNDTVATTKTIQAISVLTGGMKGAPGTQTKLAPVSRPASAGVPVHPTAPKAKKTDTRGGPKQKVPAGKVGPVPPKKLSNRQRKLQRDVQRLKEAMPDPIKEEVTLAIVVVEKAGRREQWVVASVDKVPPEVAAAVSKGTFVVRASGRKGNRNLPKERRASLHHATHDGIRVAVSHGYKVIEVYPSRPACSHCSGFRDMGYTVIDPR